MSLPRDPSLSELSDCGCCEGTGTATPFPITNRPGLPAVAYRVGTHAAFKRSLLAALSDARRPALAGLNTREDDDLSIALLDCAATVADVLAFYSERIVNESYLRTATERRSVLELARLIGYELAPGVAADALLAFTLEDAVGAPLAASLEPGLRVQSIPKPGELPQTFETVVPLEARAEWNALRPRQRLLHLPHFADRFALLDGIATGLRPGDGILIIGDERKADRGNENWDFRVVDTVEPDAAAGTTRVTWTRGLGKRLANHVVLPAAEHPEVYALRLRTSLFGAAAPDWRTLPNEVRNRYLGAGGDGVPSSTNTDPEWPHMTIAAISFPGGDSGTVAGQGLLGEYFDDVGFSKPALTRPDAKIDYQWGTGSPVQGIGPDTFSVRWTGKVVPRYSHVYTFSTISDDGVRLWVDGRKIIDNWTDHPPTENSGKIALKADREVEIRLEFYERTGGATIRLFWASRGQPKEIVPESRLRLPNVVHLDAVHKEVVPGGWLVLQSPSYDELYAVEQAAESSRQGFALAGKTTRLSLDGENLGRFNDRVREVATFGGSEQLRFAERPILDPVEGDVVDLEGLVDPPPPGRALVVSGRRSRVRVQPGGALTLVPDDGSPERELGDGEELVVLARPAARDAPWRLRDDAGVEGTVLAGQQRLAIVPAAADDDVDSEAAVLLVAEPVEASFTRLTLESPLVNVYDRTTVTIAANIAAATHGESRAEVLGNGDAARPFARFALRESPLTYVGADVPGGALSTLEVRVNSLLWHEVPSLHGHAPRERVYVTRRSDDGTTAVEFGDGASGARPPTGHENVTAAYRKGIGRAGNVDAGQLSLLLTRPLGVKSVLNPLAALGGQDPQELADARDNAPLTVLTLDRVVSLLDYEDFARAFAGIVKAAAVWTWNVDRRGVLLTVAGPDGAAVPQDGVTADRLRSAIAKSGDARVPVVVRSYRPLPFRVGVVVEPDPDALADAVCAAVEAALLTTFSFAARDFGQPVALSEVIAVVQSVAGVVSADVDRLYTGSAAGRSSLLTAEAPRAGEDAAAAQGAQLLTVDLRHGDVQVSG